jgi:hypothetical protein
MYASLVTLAVRWRQIAFGRYMTLAVRVDFPANPVSAARRKTQWMKAKR